MDGLVPGFLANLIVFTLFYFFGKMSGRIFSKEQLENIEARNKLQEFNLHH